MHHRNEPGHPGGRVTIYDVARHAGVSKSLVSLVLRDSPQVSPARREAVQRAITELGYRPSRAAATLAGQRSNTIAVVIDDFANPWFVELLAGIRRGLQGSGCHVSVADSALNSHLDESPVQGFLAARADGLVLAAEPSEQDTAGIEVPTVLVGSRWLGVAGADRVVTDEASGAAMAVDHLYRLGHRRIAFLAGSSGPADERAQGYRAEALAHGLDPIVTAPVDTTEAGGYAAARGLLAEHPDGSVSAVIAANDPMALGAWQALREAGLQVPRDVSLIGFDNSALGAVGLIQLTSVDIRSAELGVQAASRVLARIADPGLPLTQVALRPRLVQRATTGPYPG
ncbi:MAG: LacI family DNA-binding transcriptional regulator [Actinomycetales bacterium]